MGYTKATSKQQKENTNQMNDIVFDKGAYDMLKAHDIKLANLCKSMKITETNNESFRKEVRASLKEIMANLRASDINCLTNRTDLKEDLASKFVRTKTFWTVFGIIGGIWTVIMGIVAFV